MALDKAELLEELERAYYSGAQSVTVDGHTVTYASSVAMRARIDELQAELGIRRARTTLYRPSRGAK